MRIVFIVVVAPQVPAARRRQRLPPPRRATRARAGLHPTVRQPVAARPAGRPPSTRRCSPRCSRSRPGSVRHSSSNSASVVAFLGAGTVALVGLLGRRVATPTVGLDRGRARRDLPDALPERSDAHGRVAVRRGRHARAARGVPRLRRSEARSQFVALGAAIGFATLTRAEGVLLGICWWRFRSACSCAGSPPARGSAASRSHSESRSQSSRRGRSATRCGSTRSCRSRTTSRRSSTARTATPPTAARNSVCGGRRSPAPVPVPASEPSRRVRRASQGFDIADPHFDEAQAANADTRAGLELRPPSRRHRCPRSRRCAYCARGVCTRRSAAGQLRVARRPAARLAAAGHVHVLGARTVRDRRRGSSSAAAVGCSGPSPQPR